VAYYLMDRWLSDYAYRVDLTLEYFFVGLLIMLGFGLLSVVFQTVKAAGRNPADTLRDE
jgi:putative ABC transport system permease protein